MATTGVPLSVSKISLSGCVGISRGNRRQASLAEIAVTRKIHKRGFADTTKSQQMRYEYENE